MGPRADYLEGLLDLATYPERPVRRAVFRQSVASLALAASVDGPGPLDGLHPEALLRSIKIAINDGLLEDLSWLAPSAAAVALYEIAGALPLGPERRDLGRRVLSQLYEGNAGTFIALATRVAAGSARGLSGAGIRARVSIAMSLPSGAHVPADALALALASRRELTRDWIIAPSTGSLPERRLAGRLLERAAREAVRRAMQGEDHVLRLFRSATTHLAQRKPSVAPNAPQPDPIAGVLLRMLGDQEPLVWRHVAAARGLLAGISPELTAQISELFAPDLAPAEWRRAATSLVASIAVDPYRALARSMDLLNGPLLARDSAIATAMVWGVRTAADLEPEAAEELLNAIAAKAPITVAESVAELRSEIAGFGARAAERCASALAGLLSTPEPDDGLAALARSILRELSSAPGEGSELAAALRRAVDAFVETGTREAHTLAQRALALASETVSALLALEVTDEPSAQASMSRRAAAALLHEVDAQMLESGLLKSLLLLDRRPSHEALTVAPVDDLEEQLAAWLLRSEAAPSNGRVSDPPDEPVSGVTPQSAPAPPHVTLHQRQLRALLHLIDGDAADDGDDPERRGRVRARWTDACNALLSRLTNERSSHLRHRIAATVARALDALVRDGAADAADILLLTAMHVGKPGDLEDLAEASMHADVTQLVQAYARFAHRAGVLVGSGSSRDSRGDFDLTALDTLVSDLPAGATQRTEIVRGALSRLARALASVRASGSFHALISASGSDPSPLAALEDAIAKLAQLTVGARRRTGDDFGYEPHGTEALSRLSTSSQRPESPLQLAIQRALGGPNADAFVEVGPGLEETLASLKRSIPPAIAGIVTAVLESIAALPLDRPSAPQAPPSARELPLPAWLPTRRTLGGFYVHRQLGGGSLGTVFVVTRAEERHDPHAERFALKVPDYDATAARSVSEADFLKLFREEAGALLSVPEHPNLARFVTFDAGARPKPILVMELIEGVPCDRLVTSRGLTMEGAIALLDGVLSGLEAMHSVDVGHLDIKPSNVLLRSGREPVLVDFGLAGRHIRPGCATAAYGAPEVWGIVPEGATATPLTADVYSFGCLAYEVFTGTTLFDEPTDIALISSHLTHDGLPGPVRRLAEQPRLEPLAMFLFHCLRHSPNDRYTTAELRKELEGLALQLKSIRWPVAG